MRYSVTVKYSSVVRNIEVDAVNREAAERLAMVEADELMPTNATVEDVTINPLDE